MLCTRKLSRNGDNKVVSNLFDIVGDRVRSTIFFWFTYFLCKIPLSNFPADDSGCRLAAPESQLCGRDDRNYAADYLRGDGGWVATSERPVEVENKYDSDRDWYQASTRNPSRSEGPDGGKLWEGQRRIQQSHHSRVGHLQTLHWGQWAGIKLKIFQFRNKYSDSRTSQLHN